jgi:uncharacterized protein YgiM (DUF1202 family)
MPTFTIGTVPYLATLYATTNANLRDGPSTAYAKVGSLTAGQQVTAGGSVTTDGESWVVVAAGKWVLGKLLADKPPAAPSGGGGSGPADGVSPTAPGGNAIGSVFAAVLAAAAGYAAYRWASKKKGRK